MISQKDEYKKERIHAGFSLFICMQLWISRSATYNIFRLVSSDLIKKPTSERIPFPPLKKGEIQRGFFSAKEERSRVRIWNFSHPSSLFYRFLCANSLFSTSIGVCLIPRLSHQSMKSARAKKIAFGSHIAVPGPTRPRSAMSSPPIRKTQ